jgi:hypothetical protein
MPSLAQLIVVGLFGKTCNYLRRAFASSSIFLLISVSMLHRYILPRLHIYSMPSRDLKQVMLKKPQQQQQLMTMMHLLRQFLHPYQSQHITTPEEYIAQVRHEEHHVRCDIH